MKCSVDKTLLAAHGTEFIGSEKEYIKFNELLRTTCAEGLYTFTGDMERTCLPDATLSGEPLKCVAQGRLATSIYNYTIYTNIYLNVSKFI